MKTTELETFASSVRMNIVETVDSVLERCGCGIVGRTHMRSRDGVWKWASYCAWSASPTNPRVDIAVALALHMAGIKFIDDLIDKDTEVPPEDLILGARLLALGGIHLGVLAGKQAEHISRVEMDVVWRSVVGEDGEARRRPKSIDEWCNCASRKAGILLRAYYSFACAAIEVEPVWANFMFAQGMLLMIRDDARDYILKGERSGNILDFASPENVAKISKQYRYSAEMELDLLSRHCGASTQLEIVRHIVYSIDEWLGRVVDEK